MGHGVPSLYSPQFRLDRSKIMRILISMNTDSNSAKTKKAYQAPKLVIYGKLEDLTQTAMGAGADVSALGST